MKRVCGVVSMLIAVAVPLPAAGQPAPPPSAARSQAAGFERTAPYRDRVSQRGAVLMLTVTDVVQRAAQNNLDILVERYNQELVRQRIVGAQGFYDPALSWTSSLTAATNPLTAASGATTIPT